MKHKNAPVRICFIASFAGLLTLAVVTAVSGETPPSKDVASTGGGPALVSRVDSDLRNCEFDRREEFLAFYTARNEELATRVTLLRSVQSAALASPEQSEAMTRLTAAQESFGQKLKEAGSAAPETWNAARDSVAASWDQLVSLYTETSETR